MIRITLSRKLGELRWTQADLACATGIRPSTIIELYHDLSERVNLEHLDLICEALDCELSEIIERIPKETLIKSNSPRSNEHTHAAGFAQTHILICCALISVSQETPYVQSRP